MKLPNLRKWAILPLALLLVAPPARSATIVANFLDNPTTPLNAVIRIKYLSGLTGVGTNTLAGYTTQVSLTNGAASFLLNLGRYEARVGANPAVTLYVPDSTNTFQFNALTEFHDAYGHFRVNSDDTQSGYFVDKIQAGSNTVFTTTTGAGGKVTLQINSSGGGISTPGGSSGQLQFNSGGVSLGGASGAQYDSTTGKTTLDRLGLHFSLERDLTNAAGAAITFDLKGAPVLQTTNLQNQTITLTSPDGSQVDAWRIRLTGDGTHTLAFVAPGGYTLTPRWGTFNSTPRVGITEYDFEQAGSIIYYDTQAPLVLADLPSISASTLLGRGSAAGSGSPVQIQLGTNLSMSGTTLNATGGSSADDTAFASSWNGVTSTPPSKNAVYDWAHLFDTDDDGKVNVLDMGAGIVKTDSSGNVSAAVSGTDYAPATSGTALLKANGSGGTAAATVPSVIFPPVTLTDAATVATDASQGFHFRVTLGGNRTLGNPTNPTDGQVAWWEIIQDATGSRTLTLDTKWGKGTTITDVTLSTTASKRDFMQAVYNSTADKWYIVRFVRGY